MFVDTYPSPAYACWGRSHTGGRSEVRIQVNGGGFLPRICPAAAAAVGGFPVRTRFAVNGIDVST